MRSLGFGLLVVGLGLILTQSYAFFAYGYWPSFDIRTLLVAAGLHPTPFAIRHPFLGLTVFVLSAEVGAAAVIVGGIFILAGGAMGGVKTRTLSPPRISAGRVIAIVLLVAFGFSVFGLAAAGGLLPFGGLTP